MTAITDLYSQVARFGSLPDAYIAKMMHDIPEAEVVDRAEYLTGVVENKVIFDLGAVGPMSEILRQKAYEYNAADKEPGNGLVKNYHQLDLDEVDELPDIPGLELIVAGEVLEHLSNAGHFLDLLHGYGVPVILTVPNCFSAAGRHYLGRGVECVNREHVAWYSYHTLKVLIERHRFRLVEWFWYNGKPLTAEGLIFHMEPVNGND